MIGRVRCTLTVTLDRGIIDVALKYGAVIFTKKANASRHGTYAVIYARLLRRFPLTALANSRGKVEGALGFCLFFLDDLNTRSSPVLQAC